MLNEMYLSIISFSEMGKLRPNSVSGLPILDPEDHGEIIELIFKYNSHTLSKC